MTPNRMLLAALFLPTAYSAGVARPHLSVVDNGEQDELIAALDRADKHAEERRHQLAREAGVDAASLAAESKRLMRQEARSDRPVPASLLHESPGDGEDVEERHPHRQRRHHKDSSSALIAGDPMHEDVQEDESDKDEESDHENKRQHCPETYKIRGAEAVQPLRMGIFTRVKHQRLPLWENTNKEYLYFAPDYLEWRVGDDFRKAPAGVASTPNEHAHCPHKAKDWYAFYGGNWTTQFNISVVVEDCPVQLWVTGVEDHQPKKMGTFYMTLHEKFGRPVYENEHHMFMYYWPEFGEWRIGEDWEKSAAGVASKRGEHVQCPQEAAAWSVFHNGQWFEVDLRVLLERPAILGGSELHHDEAAKAKHVEENYHRGVFGENQCPMGTREMTEEECMEAAHMLNTKYGGVEDSEDKPRACSQDKPEGHETVGHIFYNKNPLGMPSEIHAPFCHKDLGHMAPTHAPRVMMRAAAPATPTHVANTAESSGSTASDASAQEAVAEAEHAETFWKSEKGKKSKVFIIVAVLILILIIAYVIRRRMMKAKQAQLEAEERKAFAGEDQNIMVPAVGAKAKVKSTGREGLISEEAAGMKFKVTYDDDGSVSDLLPMSDIEVLKAAEQAATQKGSL